MSMYRWIHWSKLYRWVLVQIVQVSLWVIAWGVSSWEWGEFLGRGDTGYWAWGGNQFVWAGIKMGFEQKVWKRVMASLGCLHMFVKWTPNETSSSKGCVGVLPQKYFGSWGCKWCSSVPIWVTVLQYPYPPLPLKNYFSSDLHWSQEWSWELEKKVWKFWSLMSWSHRMG